MGPDDILRRYILPHKQGRILAEANDGVACGNYGGCATSRNILRGGIWWPTLHNDAVDYSKSCDVCQPTGKPSHWDEMPLTPQIIMQPFDKWVVNFVGPINPLGKRAGALYIITTTKYLTRGAEVAPVMYCTTATVARFLFNNVVTRFGCMNILMSDQGIHFINQTISTMTEEFKI